MTRVSPPTEAEVRDCVWTIIQDRDLRKKQPSIYRWARAYLDAEPSSKPRQRKHVGHTCGFTRTADGWRCTQDYFAVGESPDSGCGALA